MERAVLLGNEFDGARTDVANRACGDDRGVAHRLSPLARHTRRRRFFDDLLMPPLHRAIALEKVHGVAVRVGEDLDFDVSRRCQIFFDQHAIIAERPPSFALRRRKCGAETARVVGDLHSFAPAASGRLDQHRIADLLRFAREHRR